MLEVGIEAVVEVRDLSLGVKTEDGAKGLELGSIGGSGLGLL